MMLLILLEWSLRALAVALVVATFLPMWRTDRWWVRLLDFPRFQIAVLAIAIFGCLVVIGWPLSGADLALVGAVALAGLWQLSWIWRYLPGAPREVPAANGTVSSAATVALMTVNVYRRCRDADSLVRIARDADPDLLLAIETDEWWCSRLSDGLAALYPHRIIHPLSNGYGLSLFSRLELVEPAIRYLVDEQIPSIKTGIRLRSGAVIDLYGVHPQPPAPSQDSAERDVELVVVGKEISRLRRPAVMLGDLNDVAWSPTTSRFKGVGGLQDPRRGRGFFNTYPARLPALRYPLDYIFHTPHFAVAEMRVLPRFMSDHLPLIARLVLKDA